eukprot:CAMPEP_0202890032 /NCGR_PEP_ID=MMETSP1392-20130828/555_1 /ASSEMBLY_ACC=CAM_ASM_000868 /TAXON_ID=225041 /ORGANISM="Chlamydomonas chlamydogama, Strain SAG 11-48b" /LENGTH=128 /DNA_ID=CAMNT_0049573511 /DNA_START=24 /DNA_END=410 /DNA_ORIENTATION=+
MASLLASTRLASGVAFRAASAVRPMAPRAAVSVVQRPSSTSSSFLGGSFSGAALAAPAPARGSLVVMAAGGKSMACTKGGTRRKRRRTSGFRTRMQTPSGRKVLAARRKKGRHSLCPASENGSAGKKK